MSRYYDYDYDNNCIICFGSDTIEDDTNYISLCNDNSTPNSTDISPSTSPSSSYSDLHQLNEFTDDKIPPDCQYIFAAPPQNVDPSTLKPIQYEVPFLLVSDMIKKQQIAKKNNLNLTFGDSFSALDTDSNIYIDRGVKQNIDCESLQRFDDFNGSFYNSFGSYIISPEQCHVWRFQILGNTPAIIGIIECEAKRECAGAYFGSDSSLTAYSFNTVTAECYNSEVKGQQPRYQQVLQSGILDKPMIIDMKLDLYHGTMTIANQTNGSQHFGKEILLFKEIKTKKSYKLAIALLGSETINLF